MPKMKMSAKVAVLALLPICVFGMSPAYGWPGASAARKFIFHGWDTAAAGPEEILENADAFAASGIDGVVVALRGKGVGGMYSPALGNPAWRSEYVLPRMATLKEFKKHDGLKESFLVHYFTPKARLGWDDDAAWERAEGQLRDLGRIGAGAGMKGYVLDHEDYNLTNQLRYDPVQDGPSYEVAYGKARRRGAQVFGALLAEHPDAVLLIFEAFTEDEGVVCAPDQAAANRARGNLWSAVLNGLLDVLPPTARFVDGNENSYWSQYWAREYYVKASYPMQALGLVAPENRAKYKAQMEVSFGYFFDFYLEEPKRKKKPEDPTKGMDPVEHFSRNLQQGALLASEYVWLYGEKRCIVPWKKGDASSVWKRADFRKALGGADGGTWEGALPGISEVMRAVKDPFAYSAAKRVDEMKELVVNGACLSDDDKVPKPFTVYQEAADSNLVVFVDSTCGDGDGSSFGIRGVAGAKSWTSIKQDVPVEPCGLYRVAISVKGETRTTTASDRGSPANVRWKRNGAYDWHVPSPPIPLSGPDADGWRRGVTVLFVPHDIDTITLQVCVPFQKGENVDLRFDNFSVKRVK